MGNGRIHAIARIILTIFFFIFQEATQALIEATTTPRHHHVQENDDDELDDEENNMNGEHSTDLRDNDDEINDPVCFDDFFLFQHKKSTFSQIHQLTIYYRGPRIS